MKRFVKILLLILIPTTFLAVTAHTLTWNGFTLASWWSMNRSGRVIRSEDTRVRVVALTFDDGPDPNNTPRILALLRQYKIHATFFEEGRCVRAYPAIARNVLDQGHVIGNHTETHPYLEKMPANIVHQEMNSCERDLEKTLGIHSYLFRPPRGYWNPTIFLEARREGNTIVLWNVALEHHEVKTPRAMADRALHLIRPGSILLMHDGAKISRELTVQALPLLLQGLRQRGYRCVTVPELLHIRGMAPISKP